MSDDRVIPACQLDIESEPPVRVWVSGQGIVAPDRVGECVRASLGCLEGQWAYELHQYLANNGNQALLYQLDCGEGRPMAVSFGGFRAPFGEGLMLGARVSSRDRVQLGVSVLTAFALSLSQGADPVAIRMADLGQRIRDLDLPVQ